MNGNHTQHPDNPAAAAPPPPPPPARCYRLPERFVYLELTVILLLSALVIFAWVPALLSIFRYGSVLPSAMRAAIFLNITAASLLLVHLFVKREIRRVQFILTGEYLAHKTTLYLKRVRLADIRSVNLLRLPAGHGMLSIGNGETAIAFADPEILQLVYSYSWVPCAYP